MEECEMVHGGYGPTRETRLFPPLISFPISSSHMSYFPAESVQPPVWNSFCMGKGFLLILHCLVCSLTGQCFLPLGC